MENVKQTSGVENDGRGWGTTLERVVQKECAKEVTIVLKGALASVLHKLFVSI